MGAPIFEKSEEIIEIVKQLVNSRNDLFDHVDPLMINAVLRTDKDAPASQKIHLKIKGIRGPVSALTDKKYVIFGYESDWARLTQSKKIACVAFCLKQIDYPTQDELNKLADKGEQYEWGKTVKPDVQSFKSFINGLGTNWEDEREVPNILEDNKVVV